jgi:hypothetical protein
MIDDGYRECVFCASDILPNSECYCVQAIAWRQGAEDGDARVFALLTAIGNPGQCKDCGEDVFFVLHHKDRGVAPSTGFAYANKWREWRKFEPDGTPHKHARVSKPKYDY